MIKIRDRFLRKPTRDKSENNLVVYIKFRTRVANELKTARKKYFRNYFEKNGKNIKKLWLGIERILAKKILSFLEFIKSKTKMEN